MEALCARYLEDMTRRGASTWTRWALLCALAWGVVAMHHVGMAETSPSMAGHTVAVADRHVPPMQAETPGSHVPHDSGMNHDMFHLCLAVLCAVVAVALAGWLLYAASSSTSPCAGWILGGTGSRAPPPRQGRDILTTFCVLRI